MRKPFFPVFGTFALAAMALLAQAQDKPSTDQAGSQKPAQEKTAPAPPAKDQPVVKPALLEKDKNAPQKGVVPPANAGKIDPPKTEYLKKEPAKVETVKVVTPLADWDQLKGEWVSANFEFDGRAYPADGRWSIIFEKQKEQEAIKFTGNPPTLVFWTGPIRLDASKTPREITLVQPALIGERLQRGIYTLDGDYLTIAWPTGFDAPRPATFASKPAVETEYNKHIKAEPNGFTATWVRKKPPAPK